MSPKTSLRASLRAPLTNVLGSGSAKNGVHHWWVQRVSAVALVPLALWLLCSLVSLPLTDYATVAHWIGSGWHPVFLVLLIAVAGWHGSLGVQVVIEDYVHGNASKTALLLASLFVHVLLVTAGIYAVLRIALRSFG